MKKNFIYQRKKETFLDEARQRTKVLPIENHVPCGGLGTTTQINPRLKRVRKNEEVFKFLDVCKRAEFVSTKINAPKISNTEIDRKVIKGYL